MNFLYNCKIVFLIIYIIYLYIPKYAIFIRFVLIVERLFREVFDKNWGGKRMKNAEDDCAFILFNIYSLAKIENISTKI